MHKFITCKGCGAQWYAVAQPVPWSPLLRIPRELLICRECGTLNMKTKRTKIPQFDLPTVGSEVFNLASEQTADGERLRREMEAAAEQTRQAAEIERQQQPSLL